MDCQQMTDEAALAPSAGQNGVRSHLYSTSLWLRQHLSRLTAQHDAVSELTVGSKVICKTRTCPEESQRRKCEGRGVTLTSLGVLLCCSFVLCCVVLCETPGGLHLYPSHTESHIAPDTSRVCCIHKHKLCSHPPLPLIQCSNSALFCNTVTQSHQLFIKDFCTCSVIGLIDT